MALLGNMFSIFNLGEDKIQKSDPKSIPGIPVALEKQDYIENSFNEALEFEYDSFEKNSEAWKLYSGFESGQWPDEIKNNLLSEGKNPFQANFIRAKVDGLAGGLIKNYLDVDYEPTDDRYSDLTRFAKELFYIDKELMDWKSAYKDLSIDGLVYLAVGQLCINDRYNPLGNIELKRVMPGHVILDPNWLTNSGWDLKRLWKAAYLSPTEVKQLYNHKSEEIEILTSLKNRTVTNYDNGDISKGYPHYNLDERYEDKYRVIEYHHIEREKKEVEIAYDSTGELVVIPEGTDEFKKEWVEINKIDTSNGTLKKPYKTDVYYVSSICPELSGSMMLEDRKSNIQIGRLPFFPWSSGRINGTNSGIPYLLKSLQQTYNKRESMIDDMISSSANGLVGVDPSIVGNDDNQKRMLAENWNKTNFKFWTEDGVLASGRNLIQEFPKTTVDYGIINELDRMVDVMDRVSKQPSASDGRSEGSEETGILYARKLMQAEIAQAVLSSTVEHWWNEIAESYLLLGKQLYSGVYRTFKVPGEERTIEINKPVVTPSGEIIENDISTLPRMRVIVTQSPEGVSIRDKDRAVSIELLRTIGPENPISRSHAVKNVMKTLPGTKKDKAEYVQAAEIENVLATERAVTEIKQLKFAQAQIDQQMGGGGQQPPQGGPPQPQQEGQPPQGAGNPAADLAGSDKQLVN